jgi:hypothetical protein
MPYPDLLDPASRSRPALGRPFPVFGTVLLALAIVGAGLLFVPPARLIGLLLVLPVGTAVLYVWFRNREQTNGVLTVVGLAVLAVTLGIGVAMTIAARTTAADTPADPNIADPSTAARPGSTVGYVGTAVTPTPTPEPAPMIALTPAPPLPADRTAHRLEPARPRKTTEPTPSSHSTSSSASAPPSGTPAAGGSPDSRTNDSPSNHSRNTDSRNDSDSRNDTDSESARATADRRSDYCSVGQYKINNNGTADVCGDQDDQGHYIWRRNVPPPDDDH